MSFAAGTRLGPYEILAPIGAGGMGAVYKARDTRLERVVAVKVILAAAAGDPEFRERFDREARAVSALDHPHICTLHDVGHDRVPGSGQDVNFIVMQFLEGETLADRLARSAPPSSDAGSAPAKPASGPVSSLTVASTISRGPIPLEMVLRIGRQMALALNAAHRRGIVHRDLKPGNVMLTKSGIKLLDFGLAKLAPPPVAGFEAGEMRTLPGAPAALTGQGTILGTLHYMSPEQLEGRDVDARSDIFAFGAVLFEMLSGRRAFDAPSQAGVIAAIVAAETPALGGLADTRTHLPITASRTLERLLHKCFAKDPDDRWQSAADLADELAWINEERLRAVEPESVSLPAAAALPTVRTRERLWMAIAGLAVAAAVTLGVWLYPRPVPLPQPVTFTVGPPDGSSLALGPGLVEVSPDGQRIAFVTSQTGLNANGKLWIRALGSLEAMQIASGEGAWHPVWSPTGQSIVFTGSTGGSAILKRVELAGGPALTLADVARERPAWSPLGVILYTGQDGRLYRVAETGGTSSPVTDLDKGRAETLHAWPEFLPDGRRFLYLARSSERSKSAIYLASIDTPGRTHVLNAVSMVEYLRGYLVYQIDGTIMAHPFDEAAGRLAGDPMPIVENVQFNEGNGRAAFSVSPTGVLAYRAGSALSRDGVLTWFDATGTRLATVGPPARYQRPSLSPDGRRLVASVLSEGSDNADLMMLDLERGVPSRFTSHPTVESNPIWSPDAQSVVFRSNHNGAFDLYIKPAGGATAERPLLESNVTKVPVDFSPDGKLLLFTQGTSADQRLWALPMTGDAKPYRVFPESTEDQFAARFSPDGKWIAYTSGPPGKENVYVQPFPPTGARERISATTGLYPRWSADGRKLFFVTADERLMAVDVSTSGAELRVGLPHELFMQRSEGPLGFNMDPDGRRFLLVVRPQLSAEEAPRPLTVVLNWPSTFRKRP
jgi:serine/threonine protein kinase/Tol biopolymer transport system component